MTLALGRIVKNTRWLVLFIWLVGLFIDNVTCYVGTVKRRQYDIFSIPKCFDVNPSDFCTSLSASSKRNCTCECLHSYSTFFLKNAGDFSCIANSQLRNSKCNCWHVVSACDDFITIILWIWLSPMMSCDYSHKL